MLLSLSGVQRMFGPTKDPPGLGAGSSCPVYAPSYPIGSNTSVQRIPVRSLQSRAVLGKDGVVLLWAGARQLRSKRKKYGRRQANLGIGTSLSELKVGTTRPRVLSA